MYKSNFHDKTKPLSTKKAVLKPQKLVEYKIDILVKKLRKHLCSVNLWQLNGPSMGLHQIEALLAH